jgi:hypothetical protein
MPSLQYNLIKDETHLYGFINDVNVQDTRDKTSSNSLDLVWPCLQEFGSHESRTGSVKKQSRVFLVQTGPEGSSS